MVSNLVSVLQPCTALWCSSCPPYAASTGEPQGPSPHQAVDNVLENMGRSFPLSVTGLHFPLLPFGIASGCFPYQP